MVNRNCFQTLCADFSDALRRDIEDSSDRPLRRLAAEIGRAEQPKYSPGQMWIAEPGEGKGLIVTVVLTHVSSVIRAVLATEATFIAGHDDILVDSGESPTASELLLCAWSDTPVDRSSLKEFVGVVGSAAMRSLLMYLQRELTGGFELRALRSGMTPEGEHRILWSIAPAKSSANVSFFETGSRIVNEEDARRSVRSAYLLGTRWVAKAAYAAMPAQDGIPMSNVAPGFSRRKKQQSILDKREVANSPPRGTRQTRGGVASAMLGAMLGVSEMSARLVRADQAISFREKRLKLVAGSVSVLKALMLKDSRKRKKKKKEM